MRGAVPDAAAMVHDPRVVLRRADGDARDYERLPATLAGLHYCAFARVLLARAAKLFTTVHHPG